MKHFLKAVLISTSLTVAGAADAAVINFINLTENLGTGLGESAWNPLTVTTGGITATITGHSTTDNDSTQYAYLDWGNAGLGVCQDAYTANTPYTGSSVNRCRPDSDDNVTVGEFIRFVFNTDVVVSGLWFNNNHDGGLSAGNLANINTYAHSIATGSVSGPFFVNAGDAFEVAYNNRQFYIGAIEFARVAEPNTTLLLGLGLLALAGARRFKVS